MRKPMRHIHNINGINFMLVHENNAIPYIQKIIKDFNPEIIIELGTGYGGITYIFNYTCPNAKLYSYNLDQNKAKSMIKNYNKNVFLYEEDLLSKPNKNVINKLKIKGKKFLYCDNGNKVLEVKYYSKYLNNGDMIGVHDWGEYGEKNREIYYDDIKNELENYKPIEHKYFKDKGFSSRFWIKGE